MNRTTPWRFDTIFIGLCIALLGFGPSYWYLIHPASQSIKSNDWQMAECTIKHSRLLTKKRIQKDDMYSTDIVYTFSWKDTLYYGSAADFTKASASTDYYEHIKLVNRYAAGTTTQCWFDPSNLDKVVLNRNWLPNPLLWFVTVFTAGFMWFGLYAAWQGVGGRTQREPVPATTSEVQIRDAYGRDDSAGKKVFRGKPHSRTATHTDSDSEGQEGMGLRGTIIRAVFINASMLPFVVPAAASFADQYPKKGWVAINDVIFEVAFLTVGLYAIWDGVMKYKASKSHP